ncbi:MAG: site-2 protease family protein, partial [Planctomycetota bacterium]
MNNILEWTTQSGIHVLAVILAFSFLIFVHELGHFLAAIVTGVRVEKFMIGFDAWGLGLCKKIGQTEYGVGILPLGGYVKLAGQSDMPGEEVCTGAPDELMSKGVWARGLIFIAGVVMNFIFGFFLLVGAQLYGIPVLPATIGYVGEGGPADLGGLRPGDTILQVGNEPIRNFTGIQQAVALSGGEEMTVLVEREEKGSKVTHSLQITAAESRGRGRLYRIGVHPQLSREIEAFAEDVSGPLPGTETIRELITPGEKILAVDDTPIASDTEGGAISALVQKRPGETITLTVQPLDPTQSPRMVKVPVLPVLPVGPYDIGLRYMVQVNAVMPKSAAQQAGLQTGDYLGAIDGERLKQTGDIIRLVSGKAFQPTPFQVQRGASTLSLTLTPKVTLRTRENADKARPNLLGVTVKANDSKQFIVESVLPEGPSAGKLQAGDRILGSGDTPFSSEKKLDAQVAAVSLRELKVTRIRGASEKIVLMKPAWNVAKQRPLIGIEFSPQHPRLFRVESGSIADRCGIGRQDTNFAMELSPDLKTTTLTCKRTGEEERLKFTFETPAAILANPVKNGIEGMLGIGLKKHIVMEKAATLGAAASTAATGFVDKTLAIYRFLHKLVTGGVHPTAMGGPIIIIQTMHMSSKMGLGKLLDIMAFISINLGVLNLLPIPVLDGGHVLFLIFEGILRRKPSAKIREFAQYAGFIFLLG